MSSFDVIPDLGFLDGAADADHHRKSLKLFGDAFWIVNDSGIDDYSVRANFLGSGDTLESIIRASLAGRVAIGVDIAGGSNAEALTDLLNEEILTRALVTNFEDSRDSEATDDTRIDHIDGDLLAPSTWRRIIDWKRANAPEGFDLIMHRPVGGLQELTAHTYHGAAHLLLDMLTEGGIMFTQIPRSLVNNPQELAKICRSIRNRTEVKEVMTNTPRRNSHQDLNDTYSLIFT